MIEEPLPFGPITFMKYGVFLKNKQVEDIVLSNLIACVFV